MSREYDETQLGDLDALMIEGKKDAPVVILCHGYGADAYDLMPLHQILGAPEGTTWVFPQAPLEVPIGPHMTGRAWFHIDLEELEKAMMMGVERDMSEKVPPDLDYSRKLLMGLVKELDRPWSEILLGGFSQGAMLTTDVTFHAEQNTLGLIVFSGTLINQKEWTELAPRRAGMRFFQSHGRRDPLLGFKAAQKLEKLFVGAGMKGQLLPFDGGHEIPLQVLQAAAGYVRKSTAAPR